MQTVIYRLSFSLVFGTDRSDRQKVYFIRLEEMQTKINGPGFVRLAGIINRTLKKAIDGHGAISFRDLQLVEIVREDICVPFVE